MDLGNKYKTVNFIQGAAQDIQNKTKLKQDVILPNYTLKGKAYLI